ncbi:DUF7344 domain-containing protein [Halobaculum sp. P14]|uniref:DUF7344 domain-containing protein n=1 Tax=Halobaculum sp. P14 TaxID=3421638 RepID=UPI003EB84B09
MIAGASHYRGSTDTPELPETAIHDVLRNERRRRLLSLLTDRATASVSDLAERIAEQESDEVPAPRDVRQSVYVSLQQTHIPKLVRLGIVEQDGDGIRLSDRADDVTVHLEVVSGYDIAWSEYYVGVGLLGLLAVLAVEVGVPGFAALPSVLVAALFLAVVVASAVYQTWTLGSTVFHRARRDGDR